MILKKSNPPPTKKKVDRTTTLQLDFSKFLDAYNLLA